MSFLGESISGLNWEQLGRLTLQHRGTGMLALLDTAKQMTENVERRQERIP